ncbi:high-affinity branched-chain amino acid transport ATP-binding protein BraG [Methylobacterium phyllosphaerae]|uniref:Amino acid/amide ABC transporter ATP-binding protein 2, HAAT family n=1 Tax=Methylobacterium phyllosphaerae TaxID=418223 RepID=A0AAE8HPR0_9HYPH|nr:ABC transporter ATP-binding protein [Methylobacterium phyllosphaerae]APT33348.1 high-affinity branched-chain amino acid transport ATP-binding protein BraG [Methylobacterium phyllosphaerae]SFG58009.1 amino acid/amide ABC transporter ATP-binding protein 2, HAAT family [Methylobacterium phyllosphaerae]
MTAPAAFLEVDGIEAVYGNAILALRDVSLSLGAGEIVALLGANGAGKTTTLRAISNLLDAQRGSLRRGHVRWQGEATARLDPASLVRRGLVQVLEGRHVFGQLTVETNLEIGGYLRRPSRAQLARDLERIYAWFPRLRERRHTRAGLTSGGEQQMVAIGRALMTRPKLLLLDEPSMGLAPRVVAEIFESLARLNREEGLSLLIAEQSAHLVLEHAHRAVVLENGRVVATGNGRDLSASGRLDALYLGEPGATPTRH